MKVLVCGSRHWSDRDAIRRELLWLTQLPFRFRLVVIHGAARGADTIAGEEARALNLDVLEFPADWERYGKSAGPIRNKQMLEEGQPDAVLAFTTDLVMSRGTADMVRQARGAGVPVRVFDR